MPIDTAQPVTCVEAAHDIQCDLGKRRVLHIDADEVARRLRVLGQVIGDPLGELRIQFQTHLGELHADVGVQLPVRDGIQQLMVDFGGPVRFMLRSNTFAQRVERNRHPLLIHCRCNPQCVFNLHARNEAGTELDSSAGALAEAAQDAIAREGDEGGTQKGHGLACGASYDHPARC